MRIIVVGPRGGGKSTLTKNICQRFDIPRLELDRLWFEAGGHECLISGCTNQEKQLVQDRISKKVSDFLERNENWVVDGTSSKIRQTIAKNADNIILIRRPLLTRLLSHVLRVIKSEDRHPETKWWQDFMYTKVLVRRWWQGERSELEEGLFPYRDKLITLKSFQEIDTYLNSLTTTQSGSKVSH